MDHLLFSFLFFMSTYALYMVNLDGISLILQMIFIMFLQYLYYTLTIHPLPRFEHVQKCVSCKKMTPQHYVHCLKCRKCVPVLFHHYESIGMCVSKTLFKRYIFVKHIMVIQQMIIVLIMSFSIPYIILICALDVYVLYKSLRMDMV